MYHTKSTLCQFVRNRIRFPFLIINREKEKRKRKFETRSTLLVSSRRNTRRETGHFVPIPRRIKRGVKAYPSKTCGYTFDLRPFTRFIRAHPSLPTLFNWNRQTGLGKPSCTPPGSFLPSIQALLFQFYYYYTHILLSFRRIKNFFIEFKIAHFYSCDVKLWNKGIVIYRFASFSLISII